MKRSLVLLSLTLGCTPVPARLDPASLREITPENHYTLAHGGAVTEVDHLRIDGDSVRGRTVSPDNATVGPEIAMARDTSLVLRRAYHGTPDVEFLFLPPVLLLAALGVFLAAMGGGG